MCRVDTPDMPKMPTPLKPDPVIQGGTDGHKRDQAAQQRQKIAMRYGPRSMGRTGGMGLPGQPTTQAKTAFGA